MTFWLTFDTKRIKENCYFQNCIKIQGEYKAIICFSANKENELLHNLLIEIAPELRTSAKGHVNSKALPKLTHVIMAEEEHKHALVNLFLSLKFQQSRQLIAQQIRFLLHI